MRPAEFVDAHTRVEDLEARLEFTEDQYSQACELRAMYHAAWLAAAPKGVTSVKSKLHADGQVPFASKKWFIVQSLISFDNTARLISNHYHVRHWDLFNVPEIEKAWEHDNHNTENVIYRMQRYLSANITTHQVAKPMAIDHPNAYQIQQLEERIYRDEQIFSLLTSLNSVREGAISGEFKAKAELLMTDLVCDIQKDKDSLSALRR